MQGKERELRKETGLNKLVVVELEPRHVEWIKETVSRGGGSFQDILSTRIMHGFLLLDGKDSKEVLDSALSLTGKIALLKRWCVLNNETYSKLKGLASASSIENAMDALLTFAVATSHLAPKPDQTKVVPQKEKIDKTPDPSVKKRDVRQSEAKAKAVEVEIIRRSRELIISMFQKRIEEMRRNKEREPLTGEQIRATREGMGMIQKELADSAGRSRGLVFEIEHGRGSKEAAIALTVVLFRLVGEKFAKEQKSGKIDK